MSFTIHQGDAAAMLKTLAPDSADCAITSPPYWNLRDYGVAGQIGLELTPAAYIEKLVSVFDEVRRVLRSNGTLWLNIGDSYNAYNGNSNGGRRTMSRCQSNERPKLPRGHGLSVKTLKNKDLVGIPWMLAFALRDAGWWLRSDIIWSKPNPMPESVHDRPTKAHEYLFLLAKSERYWYDAAAIREVATGSADRGPQTETRNKRSVWTLPTMATPEAHFATFPIDLAETCMRAGCREGGVVLDPFAGAGTTGLACLKSGRAFVGVELNQAYIDIAYSRARKYYPLLVGAG